jgi:protein SCO1
MGGFTFLLQTVSIIGVTLQKFGWMRRKVLIYGGFFAALLVVFYFFLYRFADFSPSGLKVINENVQDFSFTSQDNQPFTQKEVEGKVYVAEYFFTTCAGICPKMNANMRRVYDAFKTEKSFLILSHTCMPETDSVPVLKAYEHKMLNGKLAKNADGSLRIDDEGISTAATGTAATNWFFVTGNKVALYKMARESYIIDNNQRDTAQKISDQFLHTQFFALVDKQRRVRGIYDGLKATEVDKLIDDIPGLLKEKTPKGTFRNGFSNTPN